MQSRRDQLQAHVFLTGRMVSAMLRAEPDAQHTPLRRFSVGTVTSLLVAVLLVVGFAVFGFIKPGGSQKFREPGSLVLEKETGTRYVFTDGKLRPVLNFASAKLVLGEDMKVVAVSRRSLAGVPHGQPVGIGSAPDALPDPKHMVGTWWQVCAASTQDISGMPQPSAILNVRSGPSGRRLGEQEALLVQAPTSAVYLVWNGRRLLLPAGGTVDALGYGAANPVRVSEAWLNALPVGPDVRPSAIAGRGDSGPTLDGKATQVGQLFTVSTAAGEQSFVLREDGLSAVTKTEAALVLADPSTKISYPDRVVPLPLTAAGLAAAPRATTSSVQDGLPPTPPAAVAVTEGQVPCLDIDLGGTAGAQVQVRLDAPPPDAGTPAPTAVAPGAGGVALADRIRVAPGTGLLVRAQPGPGIAGGTLYLLVDTGVRYPLPGDDVARTLGYGDVPPVEVPSTLLSLVPAGQPLDPAAAASTVPLEPQAGGSTQTGTTQTGTAQSGTT